jgi:hypothetical protein
MKVTITLDFSYKLLKTFVVVSKYNVLISKSDDYVSVLNFKSPDKSKLITIFPGKIIINVNNKTKEIKL